MSRLGKGVHDFWQNFDFCFFRFADLHSWYKYPEQKVSCTVIPVTGNVQECHNGPGFDPSKDLNQYPNQVFWHFYDSEWCSTPEENLQSVILKNQVRLESLRDVYNSRFCVEFWKSKEDYNFPEEKAWEQYRATYDLFQKAAQRIVTFLLENPETPLPRVQFAETFLPLQSKKIWNVL